MRKAPSLAQPHARKDCSKRLMAARYLSMKLQNFPWRYKQNYCECWRRALFAALEAQNISMWMFALLQQPIAILRRWWKGDNFARIFTTGYRHFPSISHLCVIVLMIYLHWLNIFSHGSKEAIAFYHYRLR